MEWIANIYSILPQQRGSMARPAFNAAWAASQRIISPVNQSEKVASIIGGTVAKNIGLAPPIGWRNTCAIRMSYILNQSGVSIPRTLGKTVSGAEKKWYFFRVRDLIDFLTYRWGSADLILPFPVSRNEDMSARRGVILFEVSGWQDASGHASLWDGSRCYDHCYFNQDGVNYRTNRASFWSLP